MQQARAAQPSASRCSHRRINVRAFPRPDFIDSGNTYPSSRIFFVNSEKPELITTFKPLGARGFESHRLRREVTEALNLLKEHNKPRSTEPDNPLDAVASGSPFHMAAIYAALAEKVEKRRGEYLKEAFIQLQKACDEKDQFVFLLRVDPRFDSIRSDSRFIKLLHDVRLEPSEVTA